MIIVFLSQFFMGILFEKHDFMAKYTHKEEIRNKKIIKYLNKACCVVFFVDCVMLNRRK